jgi:serine phosphatase RsbU (regulator of sigma subunit)
VLAPDGQVQVLSDHRPELLLGVQPGAVRSDHVATVERGSTVLLYTDGLVERRDQVFDVGIERLAAEFAAVGSADVEGMVEELLGRLLPERNEDDVALIAVRLGPQH